MREESAKKDAELAMTGTEASKRIAELNSTLADLQKEVIAKVRNAWFHWNLNEHVVFSPMSANASGPSFKVCKRRHLLVSDSFHQRSESFACQLAAVASSSNLDHQKSPNLQVKEAEERAAATLAAQMDNLSARHARVIQDLETNHMNEVRLRSPDRPFGGLTIILSVLVESQVISAYVLRSLGCIVARKNYQV